MAQVPATFPDRPLQPPRQLAGQARERFAAEAARGVPQMGAAVQEHLAQLVDQVGTARQMQEHRDVWMLYQQHRSAWVEQTQDAWHRALQPPTSTSLARLDWQAAPSFELVSDDVVENKILASRMALVVADKVGTDYDDLRGRLQDLESGDELGAYDVLRPEVLSLHLVEQWEHAGMPRTAMQLVLAVLQRALAEQLLAAYQAANRFLLENGVFPKTDFRSRVKRTPVGGGASNAGAAASSDWAPATGGGPPSGGGVSGGSGHSGGNGGNGGNGGAGGFTTGSGGVPLPTGFIPAGGPDGGYGSRSGGGYGGGTGYAGGGGGDGGGGGGPSGAGRTGPGAGRGGSGSGGGSTGGVPSGGRPNIPGAASAYAGDTRMLSNVSPLARARGRAQGMIGQLKRLLALDIATTFGATQVQQVPTPALMQALTPPRARAGNLPSGGGTLIEDYSPAGLQRAAGVIREQTAELKKKASTPNEKATIEVVALMFQSILAEDRIPAAVRVWFARLQLPVLRVALAEPEFFGTLDHPARKLIDRMGSVVMGFDAAAIGGSKLEGEIRRVVQVIEQYPETGKRVFQLVFDEFQKFLSKFLTSKTEATSRAVGVAQQIEQKETLAIQYTIELRKLLQDMPVRDEIREFLFKVWAEVLALSAVRQGQQHADTLVYKRAATELVWAASAKPNRSDRARVIQGLPKLLACLRQGMALLGITGEPQEVRLKVLSDTLADAFLSKTEAIPQARIDAMAKRLEDIADFAADENLGDLALDPESIEMMLGLDAATITVLADGDAKPGAAMLEWALELQTGLWFTLDHNGVSTQVQYAWRSERKQLHLFAAMDGASYLVQLRRLAAYLQAGLLVPQEEEALTQRATRDALAKLDANPERLLG